MNRPLLQHRSSLALLSLVAGLCSACGGGTGSGSPDANLEPKASAAGASPTAGPLPDLSMVARGTLIARGTGLVTTLTKKVIDASVTPAEAPLVTGIAGVNSATGNAKCDVQVVRLLYSTITPQEGSKAARSTAVASASLLVPSKGCDAPWPLLSHQHGTMVSAAGPGADAIKSLAAYFGSQGYVVVIPDYHGYGGSSLPYHPYLQAEPSAAVVIDGIRAARNWLHQNGYAAAMGTKLFLAGTSEGGYVTLATQRTMERDFAGEFLLTATAPTSGPYQVEDTFTQFMSEPDTADESKTSAATFILEGFQHTYGDAYSKPSDAYNAPWASEMGTLPPLLPSTSTASEGRLRESCQLPFNLKDPAGVGTPTYPGCSDTALVTMDFVNGFLSGTGAGANARMHARANNLLQNWTPTSKTHVCYASLDPMATPNAVAVQTYFAASGASSLLTTEDVQRETQDPIAYWMATQTPLHPPTAGYHGQVEAPACTSWSRHSVFDPLR